MEEHPAGYPVRVAVVGGCLAVALVGLLGYRIARAQVAFCKNAPGSGTFAYTLSLPRSSPITNSAQLLASIPGAIAVNKLDRSSDSYWRDDGSGFCARCLSPPFLTGLACTLASEPGASPYCFKVNPGEGFVVVSNTPAQYPIPGVDDPSVVLQLLQPSHHLFRSLGDLAWSHPVCHCVRQLPRARPEAFVHDVDRPHRLHPLPG